MNLLARALHSAMEAKPSSKGGQKLGEEAIIITPKGTRGRELRENANGTIRSYRNGHISLARLSQCSVVRNLARPARCKRVQIRKFQQFRGIGPAYRQ